MISLGGQLVVMGSFVFFLCYGMPVMVEHTVKEKEFIKAEVTYVGSPNYITGEATGSSTGSSYYVNSNVICSDKKEIEEIKKIHQLFIKQGKGRLQQNTEIFSNMLLPYDIQFTYEDEAGKEYKWYYDRATLAQLKELLQVEEFTSVIEKLDQVITGDAWETNQEHKNWANESYGTGDIFLTTSLYESVYELNLTPEKREDLLEAIALDVREEGMQRRYYPKERAEYILMFSKNGEYDCTSFSYHLNNTFVYITKEDIHTMSLLKEYELTNLFEEEGVVESITLQRMNPYEGINEMKYPSSMYFMSYLGQSLDEFMIQKDFGKKYTITDEDKIEALMKGMRNTYFMDEGGFFAAVKIKDKEGYRYLFLPESQVPEFVKG
ncbi:MAG TPA: hypothetical protein IAC41_02025 [Candidatus Merdenecus merdavium]|nr:hypothetical protein [Candidatus Merdenecus merdavium]